MKSAGSRVGALFGLLAAVMAVTLFAVALCVFTVGKGYHHCDMRLWLGIFVIVANIVAFGTGRAMKDELTVDDRLDARTLNAAGRDDRLAREQLAVGGDAIVRFISGMYYRSIVNFFQGGALPESRLRLAAATVSVVAGRPGLSTSALQEALEMQRSRLVVEDFREVARFLLESRILEQDRGWALSPQSVADLRRA